MMIEIFKTDVRTKRQAGKIVAQLLVQYPDAKISFDLSDCDRILRVEGKNIVPQRIIEHINSSGFCCEVLV